MNSAGPACGECPIRTRAICARSTAEELAALERMKYYRSYEAGSVIAWAGDALPFVASVVSGTATLTQTLPDGRRQMVGLLLPADFIGRPFRPQVQHDITAATGVTLCCFRRGPFEAMFAETPHLAGRLLDMTLDELDAAREWMLLLGRKSAREKIATLLAILARRGAGRRPVVIDLPLTREAMADYLGLTIETVSRQISALRAEGVIVLEGLRRIRVPDPARLLAETGEAA